MYSFITFLVITLAEYTFYAWNRAEVNEYQDIATGIADFTGVSKHHVFKKSIVFLSNIKNIFRKWWIPAVGIILFINLMIAIVFGTVLSFIVSLF